MTTKEIRLMFLNIGDILELVPDGFYYRISKEGTTNVVECEQKKEPEEGWIACPQITGSYCGCNYKPETEYTELNIIKIRVSAPFNMGSAYRNYLTFAPSQITAITVIGKHKTGVLDKLTHALVKEKNETDTKETTVGKHKNK